MFAAYRQMPEAQAWFERAAGTVKADPALSELQMAWRARVALRVQDWAALEVAIAAMPGHWPLSGVLTHGLISIFLRT